MLDPVTNPELLLEDNKERGRWQYLIPNDLLVRQFTTSYTLDNCPDEKMKIRLESQDKTERGLIGVIIIEDVTKYFTDLRQRNS